MVLFKIFRNDVIDGIGVEDVFSLESIFGIFYEIKGGNSRVLVMIVVLFILVMVVVSGFGVVLFFFVEFDF